MTRKTKSELLLYKTLDFVWHRTPKFTYYLGVIKRNLIPRPLSRMYYNTILSRAEQTLHESAHRRISYYNKLKPTTAIRPQTAPWGKLPLPERQRAYYFDSVHFLRFFNTNLKAHFLFGDITHIPEEPSLTKSRPICRDNENSVILKLDRFRHFQFVNDLVPFEKKKDLLIGRSHASQPHRILFLEKYFNHPICNIGQINHNENSEKWNIGRLTIAEHLKYKFILCLEGNDVATNLKWVMSSNSLAVMPKPTYESWFMEGTLIPNVHYIEIKPDYSDLEERLTFYINHPDEAKEIVKNANHYVKQFQNRRHERLVSLLVLKKYFEATGQAV